jgi:DNA modification methylase
MGQVPDLSYIADGLRGLAVPIDSVHEDPANARKGHAVDRIATSLKIYGQRKPIVVNREQGFKIEAGNGTWRAAKTLGWEYIAAVCVDDDPATAAAFGIADNRLGDLSEWDPDVLADIAGSVEDLFTGFTPGELADEIGAAEPVVQDAGPRMDKAEELRKEWGVELGQLWEIGDHLLICGDSTKADTFDRVMGGDIATLCVTSPPYGVGKSYEQKGIAPWRELIEAVVANICKHARIVGWNIGDLYSTGSQAIEPTFAYSVEYFKTRGFNPIWIRIWLKQGLNFGVGAYHLVSNKPAQQYEYIGLFGDLQSKLEEDDVPDIAGFEWVLAFAAANYKFVKRLSRKDRREWGYSGVWKINTVPANDDHPAMFPLELPERIIRMHTDEGDLVLEPFSGSGTTLMACERLSRKCRAIEMDPKYVAVALQRYEDSTGKRPQLRVGDGQ